MNLSALFQKYRASPDVGVPYSSSTYFMIFLTKYFTIFFLSYNWYNIENIGCQVSPIMKSNKLQRRCKNHFVAAPKRVNIAHCTLYILINVQNLKDHWVISWLCTFLRFCHSTTSRWVMNSSRYPVIRNRELHGESGTHFSGNWAEIWRI